MTLPGASWRPGDEYDDDARWHDSGWQWEDYAACRDADPRLFFPVVVRKVRQQQEIDGKLTEVVVDVPTDEEPALPPPEPREICQRCPVAGQCLERNMDQEYGIYGGTTGYQRQLMTKKIRRKQCMRCGGSDVVRAMKEKDEICLGCGLSWPIV